MVSCVWWRPVWEAIENEEEDISTERLFAMTCDRASDQLGVTVDNGDVADAVKKYLAVAPKIGV